MWMSHDVTKKSGNEVYLSRESSDLEDPWSRKSGSQAVLKWKSLALAFFIGWFPSFTIILVGVKIIIQKEFHHFRNGG